MLVVSLLILLILILRIIVGNLKASPTNALKVESFFCVIAYFCIVLLAMFRGEDVGVDTLSYIKDYQGMHTMDWGDIINEYKGYEGYYLISKIFSMLGLPYFIWFGFVELLFVCAIARFIDKFSSDRLYSIVLFLTTGLFMFSLAGLKQTLAMSLVLYAYVDFVDKKYLRSSILIVLTYFVHPVSLIALFAFVFHSFRRGKILIPLLLLFCFLICVGGLGTASLLVSITGNEHYKMYLEYDSSYTMSTLFLYLLILLCTLPYLIKYYKSGFHSKVEVCCVVLVCACQYLASLSPSLFRLALPLLPFMLVYVPNSYSVVCKKHTERNLLKLLALLGPIIFFIYSNRTFTFTFISF